MAGNRVLTRFDGGGAARDSTYPPPKPSNPLQTRCKRALGGGGEAENRPGGHFERVGRELSGAGSATCFAFIWSSWSGE